MANKLMIGAGRTRRPGWKTLDANPKFEPDYLKIIPPLPYAMTQIDWDEIEWIHGITSFYPWDAIAILRELHGVLANTGKLVLEQPDFNCAKTNVNWLFGDPSFREPLHMNRWAYTPETLTEILRNIGFKTVNILPAVHHNPVRDFRVEAYK